MLKVLFESGMVLAGRDNPVLQHLQRRRLARALVLHDARTGRQSTSRAWQITDRGRAVVLGVRAPSSRAQVRAPAPEQIDIEDALTASRSTIAAADAEPTEGLAP